MNRNPIRVAHLFAETAGGFITLLWLRQLSHFDPEEFRFHLLLPDRAHLGERAGAGRSDPRIEIHEIPSLAQLRNPVYALRSYLSLRSWLAAHPVDVVHAHFPAAALLADAVTRGSSAAGIVSSLYASAGEWRSIAPPRLLVSALRHTARRAERILTFHQAEEDDLLRLGIGKKYQMARFPLPIPEAISPGADRGSIAETVAAPPDGRWIGIFMPSLSRRELRELLTELAPLQELGENCHLIGLIPAGRLGETRTVALRLRVGPRFHFLADLHRWEQLIPEFEVAVIPTAGLMSLAAAGFALGSARAVWIRGDTPWADLLPQPGGHRLCIGQPYRLKEEVEALLSEPMRPRPSPAGEDPLADARVGVAGPRLRSVYLDVLREKGSRGG